VDRLAREDFERGGVSRREAEVLEAVAQRMTNVEIAELLGVSERTIESHVSSLLRKLGARNRVDLADRVPRAEQWEFLGGRFPTPLRAIAERGDCVGRDAELRRLLACWGSASGGTALAVVRGEAGIGKSRLAAEVAVEVHRRGGTVALGICSDGPQRPYEPFMTAIEDDLDRLSASGLERRLGPQAATFARLSRDVANRLHIPGGDVVDPERERWAVLGALHDYLSGAAKARPLLFVIEDLHWGSSGTRDAVGHIALSGGDAPLMVLVTTRDAPPHADPGLIAFLGRLAGLASVEMIALGGLDVAAAASMIEAAGGDLEAEQGVRLTGGNPLYLREVIREGPASPTLGEIIAERFQRLDPGDLDVVDLAATAGEEIDADLIAAALDRSSAQVLDSLERSEAAGLVGPGVGPGRFGFVHDVFRSVRYASLTASRRLRMHASLAEALRGRAGGETVSAELARHACLAGPLFEPSVAADLALRAGDAATVATDHGEAATHYRRALQVLDGAPRPDDNLRLEVRIRLGASLILLGDVDGLTILQQAARSAARRGHPVALAQALCAMSPVPGGSSSNYQRDQLFRSLAETALGTLPAGEEGWRIKVLALLGTQLWFADEPHRGAEMIRSAVRAARQLGDPVTLGKALLSHRFSLETVDIDQRLACGRELIELGDRTGLGVLSCVGRQQLWWCYRELGDRDEMNRWYEAAEEWVHGPDVEQLSQAATVALIDGDLERAEHITDQIDDMWHAPIVRNLYAEALRLGIAISRGSMRWIDLIEREYTSAKPGYPPELLEPLLALGYARTGRIPEAQDLLDRACRNGFPAMYAGRTGASPLCQWAETAAILKDVTAGTMLDEHLEPLAGRLVDCCIYLTDTIDRVRALIRLRVGNPADAHQRAANAVAASRRRRTPIFLARELVVLAAAQQLLGTDAAAIADTLDEARAIARRTGARIIAQDAALYLTKPVGAPHHGDHLGLTRREREILDHLAAGATNAQIAKTLNISAATVRKHLEHSYQKLGVSNRTAAATQVAALNGSETLPTGERDATSPARIGR
jgi:DNA-binding CsgD family transcriptional regulator